MARARAGAQGGKGFDFGERNQFEKDVTISHTKAAGGNITEVHGTSDDSSDRDRQLLQSIAALEEQVSQLLREREDDRQDVQYELASAKAAVEKGDQDRTRAKLESAQKLLTTLGASIPAALQLAGSIAGVLQPLQPH